MQISRSVNLRRTATVEALNTLEKLEIIKKERIRNRGIF